MRHGTLHRIFLTPGFTPPKLKLKLKLARHLFDRCCLTASQPNPPVVTSTSIPAHRARFLLRESTDVSRPPLVQGRSAPLLLTRHRHPPCPPSPNRHAPPSSVASASVQIFLGGLEVGDDGAHGSRERRGSTNNPICACVHAAHLPIEAST